MAPRRLDIDLFVRVLDRSLFSPAGAAAFAILLYRRARNTTALGCTFFEYLQLNKKLGLMVAFVFAKTFNRALTRYVVNHGWARDRPKWHTGKEVVVITGASGGIGGDIVKLLMKRTNKIAVIDVAPLTYPAGPVRFYKTDVTDEEAMKETCNKIKQDLGDPTIVIANAGIGAGKMMTDMDAEGMTKTYKVNTLAVFMLFKEFLPAIAKKNHGHFVTVASSASYMSIAQLCDYSASKSAALAIHETLGQELFYRYNAPKVRTTAVTPTKVRTQLGDGMNDNSKQFVAPTIESIEVAEEVVKQIDSGLSGHVMQPLFARTLLPAIRFMPDWYRWLVHSVGKTGETVTDESSARAWGKYRHAD